VGLEYDEASDMLPLLYRFTFETATSQFALYAVAMGIILYAARGGWLNATSPSGGEPSPEERRSRAIGSTLVATAAVGFGLHYALPTIPFFGAGQNQGIPLHTYGILIGVGFLSAVTVSALIAEREWPGALGLERRAQVFDLAFYVLVGGIVGAKILFMLVNFKQYAANPSQIFSLSGGLVFQGALLGSAAVAFWYCRKNQIEFLRLLDFGLPAVSLGAAFGRLGCFAAGCCWGAARPIGSWAAVRFPGLGVTKNLFGQVSDTSSIAFASMADASHETRYVLETTGDVVNMTTSGAVRLSDWVNSHHHTVLVHPVQLYESLLQLLLFLSFVLLRRYRRAHGQIAALWLLAYAVERSVVELFRGDAERGTLAGFFEGTSMARVFTAQSWYNVSTSQIGSLLIFVGGLWLLFRQRAPTTSALS
jgi:phosphatidylglycerol---prolipoprotein diacylglyceryl transferase